jgi:hypothetical protein
MDTTNRMKAVYTVIEREKGGKSYWMRVGIGFVNTDGSINIKLDAIPTNGTLQVREWEARDDRNARESQGTQSQGTQSPGMGGGGRTAGLERNQLLPSALA